MEKNLISVIIPAYNHEKYIENCINSIIQQTYKNIELIIIDDGSKDSTWAKIKELESVCKNRFKHIHIETQENMGTCKTLNKLISLSKGEYLYLIASDDIAKKDALKTLFETITSEDGLVLAVGGNEIIDDKGNICYWDTKRNIVYDKKQAEYLTFCDFLKKIRNDVVFESKSFGQYNTFIKGNYIPNGYLIKTSAIKNIPQFTPEAPLEDYYMHLQLSKIGKYKFVNVPLFQYRWHQTNTIKNIEKMTQYTQKTIAHEIKIIAQYKKYRKYKRNFERKLDIRSTKFLFIYTMIKNQNTKEKIIKIFGIKIYHRKPKTVK